MSENAKEQLQEALDYIASTNWRNSRPGLARMLELVEKLGNPQKKLTFVHVAGTNGKGSVCAMLAGVLQKAGYKTGLFTSPYIKCFNERIRIDGKSITNEELVEYTGVIKKYAAEMQDPPTEFELTTALALLYFAEKKADIVVFEVGLGGKLDATNIIDTPELAVINSIGLDHTALLGGTVEEIAMEKAGIIKQGGDVLIYPQPVALEKIFKDVCNNTGAILHKVNEKSLVVIKSDIKGHVISYSGQNGVFVPLAGIYQPANAMVVISAAEILREKGWNISNDDIADGIGQVRWPARFEQLCESPIVVLDGGHNPQGAEALSDTLKQLFPDKKIIFVVGVLADKNYKDVIKHIVPVLKRAICVTPENPRALPAQKLVLAFEELGCKCAGTAENINSAIECALQSAAPDDVVCVFGSLYMAAPVRAYFEKM